ncbi:MULTISPECIES: class I adenylate-forming enzyme family protein [unclassified Bradyrhizobium]|uniref:class I adenylate-forming enzyme family protein n=1 Tax=unclassified Bradyrhizobium TaxID=2631580 RepID=UPI0029163AB4|nr:MULTISPECIES: AMP-binding protein [unclassified Bradyrhizobium]
MDDIIAVTPEKPAILTASDQMTYRQFGEKTRRVASWLRSKGLERGDRLLIILPNTPEVAILIMAASRVGAIFCVLNDAIREPHLKHILNDAKPRLTVTAADLVTRICSELPYTVVSLADEWADILSTPPLVDGSHAISQDVACLIYTSGSTALPKAVVSTHRNIRFAAAAIQARLDLLSSDIIGTVIPLSFDYGLYQIFLALQVGATLALGRDVDAGPGLLPLLRKWHVSVLPVVPSLAVSLNKLAARDTAGLPDLRMMTNTGARLPAKTIETLRAQFPQAKLFLMFGLTECKRTSILDPRDYSAKPDSVGVPLPDTECMIVDEFGRLLPAGTVGELVVRGPHVMAGYWEAPELTAVRFRRWGPGLEYALFTGDRCHLDADGFLYFHGRQDDIFKVSGFRVSSTEIEAVACGVSGVDLAALLLPTDGSPSILVVSGSATTSDILGALRDNLEPYKIPERIVVTEHIPLSTNGKIDKHTLSQIIAAMAAP